MKKSFLLVLSTLCLVLTGCYVENTASTKDRTLIIASDYLNESDSLIFSDFAKAKNVRIIIKQIDPASIASSIKSKPYAHGIDLVMLRSLYSVENIYDSTLYQRIDEFRSNFEAPEHFISEKYRFIGLGVDPFVFVSNPDSNFVINNYDELKYTPFINLLSEEDIIPMFSNLMTKMDKVESYDWMKSVLQNEKKRETVNKSQAKSIPTVLTTLENYSSNFKNDSILQNYSEMSFPNSTTSGTFYNLRTASITAQAQHFSDAVSFIEYYTTKENNEALNENLHTLPIFRVADASRLYRIDSKDVMQYYKSFLRILKSLT